MLIRDARSSTPRRETCAIAVMAKASAPGRTKTRLVPPLSFEEAASLNTAFLKDVADNIAMAAQGRAVDAFMAFGPTGAAAFFEEHLPAEIGLVEAWLPDFGDCLFHAAGVLLDLGYGSVCLLNADSPTLPTRYLVEAATTLAAPGDRAVLGASTDGGYYLLGLKARHRRLFDDVAWSTERVAGQTRERIAELGLERVDLPEWYDVDDRASLRTLLDEVVLHRGSGDIHDAPHSRALLSSWLSEGAGPRLGLSAEDAAASAPIP